MLDEAVKIFEGPKSEKSETQLNELIQDLDLFLFRDLQINKS